MTEDIVSSTHPLLPPTSEDDRLDRLRLLRSRRVGISTYRRLLAEHGSAAIALRALPDIAAAAGVSDYRAFNTQDALNELKEGRRLGARLVFQGEPDYPPSLYDIDDAPPMLWALGDLSLAQKPILSLVGARNASSLGTRMARSLAVDLGRAGFVIASGLARGVDTAAHLASLKTGAIAVFAGGLDVIYPSENTRLGQDIAKQGLVLSEQPLGLAPLARHFPARNRIISGLSQAMVVVEAAARSGSLTAARHALDQGRDVLAVPGHPFEARAAGCNMLRRDGAKLVRSADDVIEALQPIAEPAVPQQAFVFEPVDAPAPVSSRSLSETAALHSEILARLDAGPMSEDSLIRALGAPTHFVSQELSDLELDGHIERQAGGVIRRMA